MQTVLVKAFRFLTCEDGPSAVEYAVMLALLVIVCIGAIGTLGSKTNSAFQKAASSMK
jgi:pilus assembly protein Flp/PilA